MMPEIAIKVDDGTTYYREDIIIELTEIIIELMTVPFLLPEGKYETISDRLKYIRSQVANQ